MMILALAALLMQTSEAKRVLPSHVKLIAPINANNLDRLWLAAKTSLTGLKKPASAFCSAMIVIPVDPSIDPKMAALAPDHAFMPSFSGQEPCNNKLP